jgi:hypothetical protein
MSRAALAAKGGSAWRWRLSPGGLLRELLARRGTIEAPLYGEAAGDLALIRETRCRVPLLLSDMAALQILLCARAAARLGGAMAEAGVLMGGSARLICEAKGTAELHLFDTFDGPLDGGPGALPGQAAEHRRHFGEVAGQIGVVRELLAPYAGVHLHPGLFPATAAGLHEREFAFVHLDLDLASGTRAALELFHPRLKTGGILVGDDYHDPQLRAVYEQFFARHADTVIELPWGQVVVVRGGPR